MNDTELYAKLAVRCERAARDNAKYGEPKFSNFSFANALTTEAAQRDFAGPGQVTLVDRGMSMTNAFGALVNGTGLCKIEWRTATVVSFLFFPRQ